MNQLLEYALKYIHPSIGWKIIPIVPHQKIPLTSHGIKDATSDETQIRAWWKKWPNANIAVACGKSSGVYVVDVDVSEAGDVNGLNSLVTEFDPLPRTIQQYTPRGGFHAFYHTDNPPANRNSFRPGIDIRGDGYYVVVTPSIHPNGGKYAWKKGCAPWELAPAGFPDFMRPTTRAPWQNHQFSYSKEAKKEFAKADATLKKHGFGHPTVSADADVLKRASLYLAQCEAAVQGCGGHDKLLWAAVAMVHGFLLSDGQALDLLMREYNPRCTPPWDFGIPKDDKDFRRKVSEARKLTPMKPLGWLLQDDDYEQIQKLVNPEQVAAVPGLIKGKGEEIIITGNLDAMGGLADSSINYWIQKSGVSIDEELEFLTHPPGLVGEICEWINETSIREQPFLTLACTLTFCGVLFGRKIRDSLGTRTNLYCLAVAESSAGKAHAPNQIRNLAHAAGCGELIGGDDTASDAGIEERLEKNPACLFMWDEIGFILAHIRSGLSQHHSRIVPQLMKLWSASGSVYKGREYADSEKQRTIVQPCCGIYGTSTPVQFAPGISPEQLQDGWLARCLIFRTHSKPEKDREKCDSSAPKDVLEQIGAWYARQISETDGRNIGTFAVYNDVSGTSLPSPPEQIVIKRTPKAEKTFIAFDKECDNFGKENPVLDCLWSKGEENARRIALVLAAGENFDSPKITVSIADYSCRLVRYLLLSFGKETMPTIVSGLIDSQKQKLLGIIEKAGVNGCLKRRITKTLRNSNKKQRDALLADLVEAEEIVAQLKERTVHFWTVENYRKFLGQQEKESEK